MGGILQHFIEKLKDISAGRILDVGTKGGGFAKVLKESTAGFDSIIGIDISDANFDRARKELNDERASFEVMNAENLKFEDDSFDTVAIGVTLHHLDNIPRVLSETKRVLKPGGNFIISEMYLDENHIFENSHHHIHHWIAEIDRAFNLPHNEILKRAFIVEAVKILGLSHVEYIDIRSAEIRPDDAEGKEIIDSWLTKCNNYLNKIKNRPEMSELSVRGKRLKHLIAEKGIMPDPMLFVIGIK
jgi:SAM-dependent methyltransferase